MKNIFICIFASAVFLFTAHFSFSQQYCIPGRFDTNYVFLPSSIDTLGGIYGSNLDWQGINVDLGYIIAYPSFSVDPLSKRPFIMLIHGGGFLSGDKYQLQPVMLDFAMKGYVCASISYRIGWETQGNPFDCNGYGYSLVRAIYRAMQDSKAALRYFAANADLYKIDTAYMFTGGISAGAVTGMLISYMTQQDINSYYPNLVNELGYLDSATNAYFNSFTVKSAISSSGGIFDTAYIKYSHLIRNSNALPVLMFHGTADQNVPYATGYAYACSNYIQTMGSSEITKRMRTLSRPFELDYVPGGGHENFYPIPYIQMRSGLFLKRYLCNDARQIIIENFTTILDTSLGVITGTIVKNQLLPKGYLLHQNYPNPFNPVTNIGYEIPSPGIVTLKVFDALGREITTIVNEFKNAGSYTVAFNASDLPNGVYFYTLAAGTYRNVKKMILVK